MEEGERVTANKAPALFDQAVQAYQYALQVYTKADMPRYWAIPHLNLEEADFAAGRFNNCIQETGIVTNDTAAISYIAVRDTLKLACQLGVGDKGAVLEAEKLLLSEAPTVQKSRWNSSGAVHVLSTSPAFEKGRTSWIALFTAVQNGDSAGLTAALHQLEPFMQH